jgi:hypothetical protein
LGGACKAASIDIGGKPDAGDRSAVLLLTIMSGLSALVSGWCFALTVGVAHILLMSSVAKKAGASMHPTYVAEDRNCRRMVCSQNALSSPYKFAASLVMATQAKPESVSAFFIDTVRLPPLAGTNLPLSVFRTHDGLCQRSAALAWSTYWLKRQWQWVAPHELCDSL